jgi:hypothetical protein
MWRHGGASWRFFNSLVRLRQEGSNVNSKAGPVTVVDVEGLDDQTDEVAAFLAADPELDSRLPEIEEKVLQHFGPETRIERTVFHPMDEEDADAMFILDVVTGLSFDEKVDRLKALLGEEDELLAPVRPQLTIGIL